MKRWVSWLLIVGMMIGMGSIAQAAQLGPVDIVYGEQTYQISVTDTSFGGAEGASVTIAAPEGQYLVWLMNGDETVGMTPVEGISLEVNHDQTPFFTPVLVDLEVDNQSMAASRAVATIDGVTFYYDTQTAPTAVYIRSAEGGAFVRLALDSGATEDPAPQAPAAPSIDVRFTVLGIEYHIIRLENVPEFQRENLMDGVEGHTIVFGYEGAEGFEEANKELYSNAKLITPDGTEIRTYSNDGNAENPYKLYFGLPDGVMLEDCTLRIIKETGDEYYPLSEAPIAPVATEEPAQEPVEEPVATEEPVEEPIPAEEPVPTEEPVAESEPVPVETALNVPGTKDVTLVYDNTPIVGHYNGAEMDTGRNMMGVSFYCADMESHIKIESNDDGMSIIVPVMMKIVVDGTTLNAADGTFFRDEVLWFFDTDQEPDTVILYPHGSEEDISAQVVIDAASGLILDPSAQAPADAQPEPADEPTVEEMPVEEPIPEEEPVSEPMPTEAPAEEPDPEIAQTAIGLALNVEETLKALAAETENPWQKAIYEAGARDVMENGSVATFNLRSFYPHLKDLGTYEDDKAAWMENFARNVQAYDLALTLDFADGADPTADSLKALKSAVSKAADEAKSAFDQKAVRIAIAETLLPAPAPSLKDAEDLFDLDDRYYARTEALGLDVDAERFYAPLFYAQTSQVMSVADGPHALVLSCKGVDSKALIETARKESLDALSKRYKANEMDEYEIEDYVLAKLIERAEAIRKKNVDSYEFTLDIDGLIEGDYGSDYLDYMNAYEYRPMLDGIMTEVWAMPDAPAQDFPKSGRISGSKSGTKVIIKAPDDGDGRYVQMRVSDTDEAKVDMFIRSGGSATVYVPKGMYYLMVASGETWYGTEGLFGDYGSYSMTSETEILGSNYYHTIELKTAEEGNMSSYGADMSDFFN